MGLDLLALLLAAQAAPAATAAAPPGKPLLVCRKVEQETGSHVRKGRRCLTEDEWDREDAERQRMSASTRVTEGQGDSLSKSAPPH
ncbi:MAG TPA: hypothetical protein VF067_03565 [Sphingomicrobium sp.]